MLKQNNTITKPYFDLKFQGIEEKFQRLEEKLDWLIGRYRAHDEEHTLLNGKASDHSDRLEILVEKLGIVI
ncbi:MAG: hypothetical protein AAB457_03825 [Patescibacteria group bacterium]